MNKELHSLYHDAADKKLTGVSLVYSLPGRGKTFSLKVADKWMRKLNNNRQKNFIFYQIVKMWGIGLNKDCLARTLSTAAGFGEDADKAHSALATMQTGNLLVVDDVGAEKLSSEVIEAGLCDIIESRTDARRATIVITNLTGDKIKARYGARLHSRLVIGAERVITLTGRDRRAKT